MSLLRLRERQTGSTRKGARKRLTALIELSATSNPEMDSGFVKGVSVPLPDLLPKNMSLAQAELLWVVS